MILNEANEVLLQKKDSGYPWFPKKWCLFGGEVEEGETPLETITREMEEELGLKLEFEFFRKIDMYDKAVDGRERHGKQNVFFSRFYGRLAEISLSEGAGFAFFAKDEIHGLNMLERDRIVLMEYYKTLT